MRHSSGCPSCGCTLYQESGPCAGVELLEAAKAVQIDLDADYSDGAQFDKRERLRAAIARAEGKS